MSSLIDIQKQIAELQARAQEIKTREFNEKVAMIKETMATYGITVEDLQGKPAKVGKVKSASPAPIKYVGPQANQTWTGRGLMPRWLKTLVETGHAKEEYLVAKEAA